MRFLLDTHAFLWFINGDKKLPKTTRSLIADMENEVLLSIASLWEIAIKTSIGKLTLRKPFNELIPEQLALNDIDLLPITLNDLSLVSTLPFHHRDPFDRMLIAQAITNKIPIVSHDANFTSYPVELL